MKRYEYRTYLLHGHASPEDGSTSKIPSVGGVRGGHHVSAAEHLLSQHGHTQVSIRDVSPGTQRCKTGNEKVESGEGHHVDGELPEVSVQLSRESEAGGHTGHSSRDEMVQVTVGGCGQLEGPEADVVEGLVVNAERLIGVLDKLMDGEGGVVGLNDSVGHLG